MIQQPQGIRRVLVAVDGSIASLESLKTTVRLAAVARAQIEGIFVEDTNLLSFAELPFSSVTGAHFAQAQPFGRNDVERELRARCHRAQQAVGNAATAAGVPWSFRVVRGNVQRTILAAASDFDLLSLGYAGVSASRRACGGSTAHFALRSAPGSVLVFRHGSSLKHAPVVALPSGTTTESAVSVVKRAALLAQALERELRIVVPNKEKPQSRFVKSINQMLQHWAITSKWITPEQQGPHAAFTEAVRSAVGGILAVAAQSPLFQGERLARLLDRGACSLMIVREGTTDLNKKKEKPRRTTRLLPSNKIA